VITFTTSEVAEQLRISPRKVRELANAIGAYADAEGTAGYRYSQADVEAIWDSMRPAKPIERKRRRRSS
jgi:hypothetical protein